MSEEMKKDVLEVASGYAVLPEEQKKYILGVMTGYKEGYEAGKREAVATSKGS